MSSVFLAIGRFFLLEYSYHDPSNPERLNTAGTKFMKISNEHVGYPTFVNDKDSRPRTNNIPDDTIVGLSDGRYALLDDDSAYFYPNVDPKVSIAPLVISPQLNVIYDTVRLHIVSGYNFPDNDGFTLRIDLKRADNIPIPILNFAYLKSDPRPITFSPTPRKLSDFVYDRYVQWKVPSTRYILDQQSMNPGSDTTLAHYLSEGKGLADSRSLYVEYRTIRSSSNDEGLTYLLTDSEERFAVNSSDDFQNLIPIIRESEDGDYFEYFGTWNGGSLEDFIFSLNSVSGNDYVLMHDIRLIEQVGASFTETDMITITQLNDFGNRKKYVPVVEGSSVASFSIDYTLRLYNRADGRSIFKTSSVTSMNVNKYGKRRITIDVNGNANPFKIYNKIVTNTDMKVKDLGSRVVNTKYIPAYIETTNVYLQVDQDNVNNAVSKDDMTIKLSPFDNNIRINVLKLNDGEFSQIDLGQSKYYIVFIKDDGNKQKIEEVKVGNKQNGELVFNVTAEVAEGILKQRSTKIYVTAVNSDNVETTLASGNFINMNQQVAKGEVININEQVPTSTGETPTDNTDITDQDTVTTVSESLRRIREATSAKEVSDSDKIKRNNIFKQL